MTEALNLSAGEYTGIFKVDHIAGNGKSVWLRDVKKGSERVVIVKKPNIPIFEDLAIKGTIFEFTRKVSLDTYKTLDGEIILELPRRPKHKISKRRDKYKKKEKKIANKLNKQPSVNREYKINRKQ